MKGDEKGQKFHPGMYHSGRWRNLEVYYCILAVYVYVDRDIGVMSKTVLQNTSLQISLVSSCLSVPHWMVNCIYD